MLLAVLSMAVGTVMTGLFAAMPDPVTATGWHMILGGLLTICPLCWCRIAAVVNLKWMALGYLTVFGSAIALRFVFYFCLQWQSHPVSVRLPS